MISVLVIFVGYVIFMIISPEKASFIHNEDVPNWVLYIFQPIIVGISSRIFFFLLGLFFPKKYEIVEEKLCLLDNGKYLRMSVDGRGDLYHTFKTNNGIICLKDDVGTDIIKVFSEGNIQPSVRMEINTFEKEYLAYFLFMMEGNKVYLYLPSSEETTEIESEESDYPSADGIHMN